MKSLTLSFNWDCVRFCGVCKFGICGEEELSSQFRVKWEMGFKWLMVVKHSQVKSTASLEKKNGLVRVHLEPDEVLKVKNESHCGRALHIQVWSEIREPNQFDGRWSIIANQLLQLRYNYSDTWQGGLSTIATGRDTSPIVEAVFTLEDAAKA